MPPETKDMATPSHGDLTRAEPQKKPPNCPAKMVIFTVNLLLGLVLSQLLPQWLEPAAYTTWQLLVKLCTMFCLSYIMIHVRVQPELSIAQPQMIPHAPVALDRSATSSTSTRAT